MPDPGLLTAVADALPGEGFLLWRHGDDVGSIEREEAATAVLAAVGKVLADRLRAEAEVRRFQYAAAGLRGASVAAENWQAAAGYTESACGVPVSNQEGQRG